MKNTDAILDAHYRAVELESARKHFALLSQFMAAIDAGDAPVALEAEMSQ